MPSTHVEPLNRVTHVDAHRTHGTVASGTVAGLVAGGAMAAYLVVAALLADAPAPLALHAIGAVLPGVEGATAAAALAGILAHALVSAGLGVLFAWVLPRDYPPACTAGVGVGYALFAMGAAIGLFLPESFVWDLHAIGGSWVIAHAIYGAVLGLALR